MPRLADLDGGGCVSERCCCGRASGTRSTPESAGWEPPLVPDRPGRRARVVRPRRARGRDRPGLGRRDRHRGRRELGGRRPHRRLERRCRVRCTCRATRRSRSRARPSWRSAAPSRGIRFAAGRDPAGGGRDRGARLGQRDPPDLAHRPAGVPGRPDPRRRGVHAGRQLVELPAAQARRGPRRRRGGPRGDVLVQESRRRRSARSRCSVSTARGTGST